MHLKEMMDTTLSSPSLHLSDADMWVSSMPHCHMLLYLCLMSPGGNIIVSTLQTKEERFRNVGHKEAEESRTAFI